MNFTTEQIKKAKAAKSKEELLAYSDELGCKLTDEEAEYYFDQWHKKGELADTELSNVSGGSQCIDGKTYSSNFPYYLITTAGNTCLAYEFAGHSWGIDNGTCYQCAHHGDTLVPMYCEVRTADDDPYR